MNKKNDLHYRQNKRSFYTVTAFAKQCLGGIFTAMIQVLKLAVLKKKSYQWPFKSLKKGKQTKSKANKRAETIKIRVKLNDIKNRKKQQRKKSMKPKVSSLTGVLKLQLD